MSIAKLFKRMLGTIPDAQPEPSNNVPDAVTFSEARERMVEFHLTQMENRYKTEAATAARHAAQLADPSTMTPDHPDYMRMVVHGMD